MPNIPHSMPIIFIDTNFLFSTTFLSIVFTCLLCLIIEKNAEMEGVSSRIKFYNGTASELVFNENSSDNVVSCLTFHEVQDTDDKLVCIKEAVRVLKPSGKFIFLFIS